MRWLVILTLSVVLLTAGEAQAYMGPGLGLGALGVVFGVLLSVGLAILAVFWYPAKRMLRRFKPRAVPDEIAAPEHRESDDGAA